MEANYTDMASEPIASAMPTGVGLHAVPKSRLPEYLSVVDTEDIPWAISILVNKLAAKKAAPQTAEKHVWDAYELSPEIQSLSAFERQKLPADYDAALYDILNLKHQ